MAYCLIMIINSIRESHATFCWPIGITLAAAAHFVAQRNQYQACRPAAKYRRRLNNNISCALTVTIASMQSHIMSYE